MTNNTFNASDITISRVSVSNFKRIAEAEIPLADITYLVGGNNSGKSSILQAIHTAFSCARLAYQRGSKRTPAKVIPESELLYRPTTTFKYLGHGKPYRNQGDDKGRISFYRDPLEKDPQYDPFTVKVFKAHNHNNAGVELSGDKTLQELTTNPQRLFSVYVPGLTGIPLNEEYKNFGVIQRTAAGGEANLVFRNTLFHLKKRDELEKLQNLLGSVLKKTAKFDIDFEEDSHQYIDTYLTLDGNTKIPVDMWGTGVLQVTQILAYALLFKPTLFLIDEPDSHLHPSMQKNLISAFREVASEIKCQIILTTHSRHMIAATPKDARVIWLHDGSVKNTNARNFGEVLLDIGALDDFDTEAKIILYTEDSENSALKEAWASLGKHEKTIDFLSYKGVKNAPKAEQMGELAKALQKDIQVIVHRDRDHLTDDEVLTWSKPYTDKDMHVFVTKRTDTESYYCTPKYIAEALNISEDEAREHIKRCISNNLPHLRERFNNKRNSANTTFYAGGGSPVSDTLWSDWENGEEMRHILGKYLLEKLKRHFSSHPNRQRIGALPSKELMEEFNDFLQPILKKSASD